MIRELNRIKLRVGPDLLTIKLMSRHYHLALFVSSSSNRDRLAQESGGQALADGLWIYDGG
jgi:hypothetical protein